MLLKPSSKKKILWRTVAVCVFILLPWAHNCQEARGLLPSALIAVKARGLLPRPQHCLDHFLDGGWNLGCRAMSQSLSTFPNPHLYAIFFFSISRWAFKTLLKLQEHLIRGRELFRTYSVSEPESSQDPGEGLCIRACWTN